MTRYGLQDGHDDSVIFMIGGDGRDLFRSPTVHDHRVCEVTVDVGSMQVLELLVEDGGDGNAGDWGVRLWSELVR